MVDVDGGQLYFRDLRPQASQAIVLIHDGVVNSGQASTTCGRSSVATFSASSATTAAATASRRPAQGGPYSPQEDLAAVMAAAKMDHASLAGFSFGGGPGGELRHPATRSRWTA